MIWKYIEKKLYLIEETKQKIRDNTEEGYLNNKALSTGTCTTHLNTGKKLQIVIL